MARIRRESFEATWQQFGIDHWYLWAKPGNIPEVTELSSQQLCFNTVNPRPLERCIIGCVSRSNLGVRGYRYVGRIRKRIVVRNRISDEVIYTESKLGPGSRIQRPSWT